MSFVLAGTGNQMKNMLRWIVCAGVEAHEDGVVGQAVEDG